jgi:epoxyqueuosine reductase
MRCGGKQFTVSPEDSQKESHRLGASLSLLPEPLAALLREEGVSVAGVAAAEADSEAENRFRRWLQDGYAAGMSHLHRHLPLKYRPADIMAGCRSVLVVGLNYNQTVEDDPGPGEGRIARYAWGRDYHKVLGHKLKRIVRRLKEKYPMDRFVWGVDSTPLSERYFAWRAGLGFIGRNTLLISREYGSWLVLGEVLSTHTFPPTPTDRGACPRECRRCLDVCPTGALLPRRRLDASRCLSYLTIENRGSVVETLRRRAGDRIFGCDLCQEVCPFNEGRPVTEERDFLNHRAGPTQSLGGILGIGGDEDLQRLFAGTSVMRAGRRGLMRNACIAAGNSGNEDLLPPLRKLASDEEPLLAELARWAVERITG